MCRCACIIIILRCFLNSVRMKFSVWSKQHYGRKKMFCLYLWESAPLPTVQILLYLSHMQVHTYTLIHTRANLGRQEVMLCPKSSRGCCQILNCLPLMRSRTVLCPVGEALCWHPHAHTLSCSLFKIANSILLSLT